MFDKSSAARHKNQASVIVTLAGQPPFEAHVFLKVDERLIDLLNDQRMFIPIKRPDGTTLIASKQNIVSIIERTDDPPAVVAPPQEEVEAAEPEPPPSPEPEPPPEPQPPPEPEEKKTSEETDSETGRKSKEKRSKKFDPYEILRITRAATLEEIKRAYHARMKAVHPDAIAALDLDEDLARAANISAQRVNRAYRTLLRERQDGEKPAEAATG